MNTKQIIKYIETEGGFDNWQNWHRGEVASWVQAYFECSNYVAQRVARRIA